MTRSAGALSLLLCCLAAGCASAGAPKASERVVEVFGPYLGVEADRFAETLQPFARSSGITVRYVGSADFVDDLLDRVGEDGDPPDLAVVPQPGLIRRLAAERRIVGLGARAAAAVRANYSPAVAALGRIDGTPFAIPFRLVVKSLVWYRPDVFAAHGWTPPRTLAELERLVGRIQTQTDLAPWCFTMGARSSTGWTATDWVEDLVLRTAGPSVYGRWAVGELPFSDPAIASAFTGFRSLVLAPGRVAGGLTSVLQTPVEQASRPLFTDPRGCALYKQADFAASQMPRGTKIGAEGDVAWFLLPGRTAAKPPILIGGDEIVQFRRDRDVDAVAAYLAGPDAGRTWARRGGYLSPKSSIRDDVYPSDFLSELQRILKSASTLAFDASDQLPPEIGSGLLWRGITDWVAGIEDYATLADRVDRALADDASSGSGSSP